MKRIFVLILICCGFDIDLLSSYDDMGIVIPCIAIWLPYKKYYDGDKVIYNDEIWDVFSIVTTDDDKQYLKITKNGQVVNIESIKVKPEPEMLKQIEN